MKIKVLFIVLFSILLAKLSGDFVDWFKDSRSNQLLESMPIEFRSENYESSLKSELERLSKNPGFEEQMLSYNEKTYTYKVFAILAKFLTVIVIAVGATILIARISSKHME